MGRKPKGDQVKETLSIRITPELRRLLELKAGQEERGLTDIIEEGARIRLAMPDGFYDELAKAAWEFEIPIATIIVNGILKKVAFETAWLKVFGKPAPSGVAEFRFNDKGLVKGDELFNQLLSEFEAVLTSAKAKLEKGKDGAITLSPGEMESCLKGIVKFASF
jgi:hypothetical protein